MPIEYHCSNAMYSGKMKQLSTHQLRQMSNHQLQMVIEETGKRIFENHKAYHKPLKLIIARAKTILRERELQAAVLAEQREEREIIAKHLINHLDEYYTCVINRVEDPIFANVHTASPPPIKIVVKSLDWKGKASKHCNLKIILQRDKMIVTRQESIHDGTRLKAEELFEYDYSDPKCFNKIFNLFQTSKMPSKKFLHCT